MYIYASKDLPSYNSIASGLAGFPYWHFPSLVDSLERTFQCIVINHFAAKTSWTPRPHIWLPHAVDIPLCVPGKWPWLEWGWGKNSRAGKFEAVRVRERNVKVESVELYVKWWAWLEFPSCWNSTSTYFYPAALTWHMSSSSAIHVLKYRRILWFFFLCCFWLHYYHRHLAEILAKTAWTNAWGDTQYCVYAALFSIVCCLKCLFNIWFVSFRPDFMTHFTTLMPLTLLVPRRLYTFQPSMC